MNGRNTCSHGKELGRCEVCTNPVLDALRGLMEEHKAWAHDFETALELALQGDYSLIDDLAHDLINAYPDGVPVIRSIVIAAAKATLGEVEHGSD